MMRDPVKNFWRQPSKGLEPEMQGRTEEHFALWEKNTGFTLPALYKAHLRQQNGGLPWPQAYVHGDIDECIFINSAELNGIPEDGSFVSPADAYGEAEMQEALGADCKLDRLYVLSWVTGHNLLCLDYGSQRDAPLKEPELCYYNDYFEEVFRLESYAKFIEGLTHAPYCYEGSWYLGIKTALPLDAVATQCEQALSLPLKKQEDDRYGWFNFDAWYFAYGDYQERELRCCLSPNRFNAGTWRFPDSPECSFILELNFEDEDPENAEESRELIEKLSKTLDSDALDVTLLMPE